MNENRLHFGNLGHTEKILKSLSLLDDAEKLDERDAGSKVRTIIEKAFFGERIVVEDDGTIAADFETLPDLYEDIPTLDKRVLFFETYAAQLTMIEALINTNGMRFEIAKSVGNEEVKLRIFQVLEKLVQQVGESLKNINFMIEKAESDAKSLEESEHMVHFLGEISSCRSYKARGEEIIQKAEAILSQQ